MRRILHAHRDGKYAAIDNRDAVVVDYGAQMIRIGLDYWPIIRPQLFRFIAFMLRSADLTQSRAAINEALGNPNLANSTLVRLLQHSEMIFAEIGMVVETVYGAGYRLHTEPRETIACCRNLAPGQPLPSRLRNTLAAPGMPLTTCGRQRRRLMTASSTRSAQR